ncbi:MAG: VapC toxin family PIN domain ribonuclease [Deltaproteobacteria bacterium]|nr:VapC toxin family PIN domain ribonuclease [Deltaproteobacteria bacterium]
MTTWLLDGNLLVALRIDTHVHAERAHRWFRALAAGDRFATCAATEGTLLRLHMMAAVDGSAAAAWQALSEVRAHPLHVFWDAGFSYEQVPHRHLQAHRQVTDVWLAALARRRRGRLATLDGALAALHQDVADLLPT